VSDNEQRRLNEIALLERRLEKLRSTRASVLACAVCHRTEDEVEFELLTDVTVVVADGEEGYSNVTLLLCIDDLAPIADGLQKLGFIDHRHGSTSTLEDRDCPGYDSMDACPTPTHYGNVTWDRRPPQDPDE
jgi:hypothetical protein